MSNVGDVVDTLPEFPLEPFEVVGTLELSDRGPYLTIKPHPRPASNARPAPAAAPNKSQASKRVYWVQVSYPFVVCHDPGDLVLELSRSVDGAPGAVAPGNPAAILRTERVYKLSGLKGARFPRPYWCSVKYGPWIAEVQEQESCTDGVPSLWTLTILGGPDLSLVWSGRWEDMPSYPSLHIFNGLMLRSQEFQCCPGFKWCITSQACIPFQVNCPDPVPA